MDISGTQLRAVRAALFTALVVTLSTASHVLLSRAPLPLNTVVVVAAAVFVIAYALAGRERGFGRIAALLIPLELAADTVFTTGQHVCYGAAGGPVTGPLRSVGFDVLCGDGTSVGAPLAQFGRGGAQRLREGWGSGGGWEGSGPERLGGLLAHADPATAWLLLGAHIGVGLLAAAWLRRGEHALAQLLRAVTATTFRPLLLAVAAVTVVPSPSVRRPRHPGHRTTTARERILVHSLGRRGPPCSGAFA
ncbi:hypothetical protein [Streptomyces sp. V4I2]|uniref:hypothetical protein n=1 Tax=Streptomyces sp. V4I2 TaxID=3042280 RepID=UPI002781B4C7|nr:hypothetical protein [Streptomyces sp. V4I2]MDQ1044710.1 hypothetical protein [Streptomyces sp. V4I2]